MTKNLYLIRHSYAEDPQGKKDIERNLTMNGSAVARSLARSLLEKKIVIDQVYCSTANRARETALNIVEEMNLGEKLITFLDIIYDASVRELLGVINSIDPSIDNAVIIGHNPAISFIGEYLTGESIGSLQPSAMVSITCDSAWEEVSQGSCKWVDYFHPETSRNV